MRWILGLMVLATILFLALPELDLTVSSLPYSTKEGHFPWVRHPALVLIYDLVQWMTIGTGIVLALLLLTHRLIPYRPVLGRVAFLSQRQICFLLITAILGPGIVVHWGIKDYYGRARPVNTEQFGGTKPYSPPFALSSAGEKSFVSGHAAMGFWFTAFGLVATLKWRSRLYIGGLLFGAITAAGRMLQGKHYLSDVLFAALLVLFINHLLYGWFFRKHP